MGVGALRILIVSLIMGLIIGFAAQRSRMCFIGGWRDFFLIRDTYLLKGFFSLLITSAILYFAFYTAGFYLKDYPWFDRPPATYVDEYDATFFVLEFKVYQSFSYCDMIANPLFTNIEIPIPKVQIGPVFIPVQTLVVLIAAFVIGLFSTLANGCPVRQHVMAASGNVSAMVYLLFFYGVILIYEKYLAPLFEKLINF